MKKGTSKFIVGFAVAASITANVYAMDVNYYGDSTSLPRTDSVVNTLNFEGDLNSSASNRIATLMIMKPGAAITDIADVTKVAHFESVSVNYDGTFEYEFSFDGATGTYPVYIKCDGESDYIGAYKHKNWTTDIVPFFTKINTAPETVTYADLEDFSQALGLDLSVVTKEGYKATVLTRVAGKASEFVPEYTQDHVNKLQTIIKDTADEFKELEKIITAENHSHIPAILTKLTELTGVTYDYKSASKISVCNALLGKEFFSAEDVKTAFDEAVKKASTNSMQSGGGSSGGSGGGGGGSYVGGNSGGAAMPTNLKIPSTSTSSNSFTDIDSVSWALKAINTLYHKGVISGKADGVFAPNDKLKREEIVKILVLGMNIPTTTEATAFDDVDANEWYADYIARAKASGVVTGVSDTAFGVGTNVTRQDIAVMIYRAAKNVGTGFVKTKTDFNDYDTVADYAREAVSMLAGEGIINGYDDGSFRPTDYVTRAEAAKMVYSAIGGDN